MAAIAAATVIIVALGTPALAEDSTTLSETPEWTLLIAAETASEEPATDEPVTEEQGLPLSEQAGEAATSAQTVNIPDPFAGLIRPLASRILLLCAQVGCPGHVTQLLAGLLPTRPSLTISPASGPPGTVISTAVSGCPPRSPGTVTVFGPGDEILLQSRFTTSDEGTFNQTPLLPFPSRNRQGQLLPAGAYPVVLECGGQQAQATFILTPAA